MALLVATTDPYGNPQCPMCHQPVEREGQFDLVECWESFHIVVFEMAEVIEMNYLDIEEQPWYGRVQ